MWEPNTRGNIALLIDNDILRYSIYISIWWHDGADVSASGWRSGGPRFKSRSRLISQSWSSYQLNQLGSKAASDSTLKQLTLAGYQILVLYFLWWSYNSLPQSAARPGRNARFNTILARLESVLLCLSAGYIHHLWLPNICWRDSVCRAMNYRASDWQALVLKLCPDCNYKDGGDVISDTEARDRPGPRSRRCVLLTGCWSVCTFVSKASSAHAQCNYSLLHPLQLIPTLAHITNV